MFPLFRACWGIHSTVRKSLLDKSKGGLRIKSFTGLNKALLYKWNWCFANEKGALWNEVIRVMVRKRGVGLLV